MGVVELAALFLFASALFLAAAKTHGRQVRLERELEGHDKIDFRRQVQNPEFVEALWKRDRHGYWLTAGIAAILLAAALFWPTSFLTRMPLLARIALVPMGAMIAAFLTQAIVSGRHRRRRLRSGTTPTTPGARYNDEMWNKSARTGSLAWALLDVVLVIGVLVTLVLQTLP